MENFMRCHVEVDSNVDEEVYSQLRTYVTRLNLVFDKEQNNFASLCYYVYNLKKLFDEYRQKIFNHKVVINGLYTYSCSANDILNGFGIDAAQTSRLLNCYEKFLNPAGNQNGKPFLMAEFQGFSKSKLFELLPVDKITLINDIGDGKLKPSLTVKEIRNYVKLKVGTSDKTQKEKTDDKEEEIEAAYDPTKYYEFSYFEGKTKSQLLNIVWELQKEYQKITKKENKIKNGK